MLHLTMAWALAEEDVRPEDGDRDVCLVRGRATDTEFARARLARVHAGPRIVEADADLSTCAVVVLPSSWSEARLLPAGADWSGWLAGGGRVLLLQPNPFHAPGETERIDLLGPSFTVHNRYDLADVPRTIGLHPVTVGLEPVDLPFPADRVIAWDDPWQPLVIGTHSEGVSLLALESGGGRALVVADNPHHGIAPPAFSDAFLLRALAWLREPVAPAAPDAGR